MGNLECAGGDRDEPDELDTDDGGEGKVAEREQAGGDQDDAEECTNPQRRSNHGIETPATVIHCHAILLGGYGPIEHASDPNVEHPTPTSDETLSGGAGMFSSSPCADRNQEQTEPRDRDGGIRDRLAVPMSDESRQPRD